MRFHLRYVAKIPLLISFADPPILDGKVGQVLPVQEETQTKYDLQASEILPQVHNVAGKNKKTCLFVLFVLTGSSQGSQLFTCRKFLGCKCLLQSL